MNGKIVRLISNLYTVKCGENLYECRARGKFRNEKQSPLVGDDVLIDEKKHLILSIYPRKNELYRPLIANVDGCLIVTSVKKPSLDLHLLDKLLSLITFYAIEPVICFTKVDLLSLEEQEFIADLKKYYERIGIRVLYNTEVTKIKEIIKNRIFVLAGQTGAGKSSLLNRLDSSLHLATDIISEALGRGKHTTRHVELFLIEEGFLADTPGFSALDLKDIDKFSLRDTFVEFEQYTCKYRDCIHFKETNCKVKEAVENKMILQSRYDHYVQFLKELEK